MIKILVSSCLLGSNTKYDGTSNYNESLINDLKGYEIIPVCPESLGGLPIPRTPSEINNDIVINKLGNDVTSYFKNGANKVLDIAIENDIHYAIFKKNSPSCGSNGIYDGTFSKKIINKDGITSSLLKENNIKIYNEDNYKELLELIK